MTYKVGETIKILDMKGEPQYKGKQGVIEVIGKDPWGDEYLIGTWGGCSVYPKIDDILIIDTDE